MRVAIVVRGGLHPSGRDEVVPTLLSVLGRLAERHDVHAFAVDHLPEPASYALNGFTVHDLGRPGARLRLGLMLQARALAAAMREQGPFDLVHGFWGDPAGVLAVRAARRINRRAIVTCDSGEFVSLPDIDYGSQRSALGRGRIRELGRGAARLHVCTEYMAGLATAHGLEAAVFPLGVQLRASFQVDRPEGPPWRLLQVATLSGVKNQALLIRALATLAATRDVHVDLAGEDTMNGSLRALARSLNVEDRVTFHGLLPFDALPALRARAHLYVQTSRHEAAGAAVLEAAAAGLPVIGTRVGYVADWAGHQSMALDDPTPETLASAIAMLLADGDHRGRLAAEAARWAHEHDSSWTAAQLDALYRTVVSGAAAPF